jgi:hypothetical protein
MNVFHGAHPVWERCLIITFACKTFSWSFGSKIFNPHLEDGSMIESHLTFVLDFLSMFIPQMKFLIKPLALKKSFTLNVCAKKKVPN